MKPVFDAATFGRSVDNALAALGWSYAVAVANRPDLNKAMLSRAIHGQALSVTNFLILCRAFRLDPRLFLDFPARQKTEHKQAVTASDKRETRAGAL